MLYTPLAESDIFPASQEDFTNRHCVSYQGKQMVVEQMSDGQYEVLQLLSTDPQDFLNSSYNPGNILK